MIFTLLERSGEILAERSGAGKLNSWSGVERSDHEFQWSGERENGPLRSYTLIPSISRDSEIYMYNSRNVFEISSNNLIDKEGMSSPRRSFRAEMP